MDLITIFLLAMALSMDALAVAVARGASIGKISRLQALKIGGFFGAFQALMPAAGWLAGASFISIISGVDHWIAFILLSAIGAKMIYEARSEGDGSRGADSLGLRVLLLLSIATSIDALAIGISLSLIGEAIALPAIVTGIVCFTLSSLGAALGSRLAKLFGNRLKIIGGMILIAIGLRVLLEHLVQ